jgi:hypothetical protein
MIDEEMLSKIIGVSVGTYPKDIEEMLVRNNVLATAPQYTTDQLVDGVFLGLNQNPTFSQEYGSWLEQIVTTLTF